MKNFRRIKAISMMLCLMMCIGSFHFARPAEAAVDVQQDMLWKVYTDASGSTMPYRLYLPADYSANKTYPTIIFLHGAGERGTNNTAQLINMLGTLFRVHAQVEQAILIAPQCPDGKRWVETDWAKGNYDSEAIPEEQLGLVMKILDEVRGEYSVDSDRIYAMGLSMGGFGTWNLLMRHSDVFAAGIPICGGADVNKADVLKNVPIWTFHGTVDDVVPYAGTRDMAAAIEAAGGKVITFTSYAGQGHGVWELAAGEPELINWLFRQRLSDRVSVAVAPTISKANYNAKANSVEIGFDTTACLWPSQIEKIVLAIYDENDQLAQVKTFSLGPVSQTVRWRWSNTKIPAKVKVFVWSNSFAMQPVSGVATATFTS